MAERTSKRAGSRRTTPQPIPQSTRAGTQSPPKRASRTTRSQSRDISDSEEKRTASKTRRGVSQDVANDQSGPQSRKGRSANHPRVQQGLSVVEEDPAVVYPALDTTKDIGIGENEKNADADQQLTQQNYKSPGGLSAFSGTTARTSFPTQELTELSPEDILDTLPDLSDAADRLLSFVIPAELSEVSVATTIARLQDKDTRERKKFRRLGDTFERQRKEYGGDSYINVETTLRRLLGGKVIPIDEQTASWRPDALLQKANLAIMVLRMLSSEEQDRKEHFLGKTAGTFPQSFAQRLGHPESLTPECSALAEATFHLALEVRTQEAIMLLAQNLGKINFDPDAILLQMFYDANELRGWAVPGLRAVELRKEAKDIILGRVEQLHEAFKSTTSDGQSSAVESLREIFPWTVFAQQMVAWAGQRLVEIEIQTMTHGGAKAICQKLNDVFQRGMQRKSLESGDVDDENDLPELRLEFDMPLESRGTSEQQDTSVTPARANELNLAQFSAGSKKSKAAVTALKEKEAGRKAKMAPEQIPLPLNHETEDSFVQVASTAGQAMRALTPQRISIDQVNPSPTSVLNEQVSLVDQNENLSPENSGEEDIDVRSSARRSLAFRKQREAESNKENDVEIPESQHSKTVQKRSFYDRDPLAERVAPIDSQDIDSGSHVIDISSDEGFQHQAGSSNAAKQRRMKPATKKVRVHENVDIHTIESRAEVAGDEQGAELPLSQGYEEYVRVNQSARQRMAVVTKPPQSRSAWTGPETDVLYNLITEHGTSWKLLKEKDKAQGGVLKARDQVALKDKARNMKMDYLKASRVLPENFERIPLSHLQIKRLMDGGIEYDPETGTRVDAEVID